MDTATDALTECIRSYGPKLLTRNLSDHLNAPKARAYRLGNNTGQEVREHD
jgi:hypothetical protein